MDKSQNYAFPDLVGGGGDLPLLNLNCEDAKKSKTTNF